MKEHIGHRHFSRRGRGGHPAGAMHEPEEQQPRGHRNFWREWRRQRRGRGMDALVNQPLSPQEMEAWREFFHTTFGNWPEDHWLFGGRRFSPWHQGMDTFNPFVATLLSKGGGLLPLYVLHLVSQQPRYGNEIMDLLAENTNGQWVANPGAIYPLLTLLEREGFIHGEWEDPEKRTVRIYTITPSGKAEVERITMIVSPKLEETIQVLQSFMKELQRDEAADTDQSGPDAPGAASDTPQVSP